MLKLLISTILPCRNGSPQYILWSLCCIFISNLFIHSIGHANEATSTTNKPSVFKKISAEEAFLQGQQHIEQANLPLAELTLTQIPTNSPYAKLLAGNIAVQKTDYNRAFLLLLPLQSNQSLIKAAASNLHANLSSIYEKQGDIANALDQLIAQETYLDNSELLNRNHDRIWHLLSELALQDLISMRGESSNTIIQGWIDLCLTSKNQDLTNSVTNWTNSYPDHVASDFAKKLLTQKLAQDNTTANNTINSIQLNGKIALILPIDVEAMSEKALAFQLGVQATLEKHKLLNEIQVYPSLASQESITEQYNTAISDDAAYFITPIFGAWEETSNAKVPTIAWRNQDNIIKSALYSPSSLLQDEAQTLVKFASDNAMQHITIISTNDESDIQTVNAFQNAWKSMQGAEIRIITLDQKTVDNTTELVDLKTKIAEQAYDVLLLATSAENARMIKPYLATSTPVLAFSSVNEIANIESPSSNLNAIRFVDIPFLIEPNEENFADLRNKSIDIQSHELLRWFALGADYLELLINSSQSNDSEAILDGLTGKLIIDKTKNIKRLLPMARFTYDGITQER